MDGNAAAAWLSVISNILLTLGKLAIGVVIGSISVISEAIHSAVDLLASFIALFAVKSSSKPPDPEHPYGHGKIENISGTVEALLIFLAAVMIIFEAVKKIRVGGELPDLGWGIVIMGFSSLVNLLVARYEIKAGKNSDSIALEADGLHHLTDVYTSLGVFIGLILIKLTGFQIIDPIAALLVALLIIKAAWDLTAKAFAPLMDASLDPDSIVVIESILNEYNSDYIEFHDLRTRKAGRESYIDLHLVINQEKSIQEAHELCDLIEARMQNAFPFSQVMIHVEPGTILNEIE